MLRIKTKKQKRIRRHLRIRKKISGDAKRPRMAVNLSLAHIYVQVIDDTAGRTIVSTSTLDAENKEKKMKANAAGAAELGKIIGEKAKGAGISEIVFDRGGYRYHGRVKALADAARAAGLKF
jgi:large subunit ribosomal protein L18